MKVLIHGWTKIAHSYSIVNVFQIVHLIKNYPDIIIYVNEAEYYKQEWKSKMNNTLYPPEYYNLLSKVQKWDPSNNCPIDIIYSITYPYDITEYSMIAPKCVFYTAEFSMLSLEYFSCNCKILDDEFVKESCKRLFFTTPSEWSKNGLEKYTGIDNSRNRVITHGVDVSIFKPISAKSITKIREFYNVDSDTILLGNIGAMTGNKGIILILETLYNLVYAQNTRRKYKLLLKGMEDLYSTRAFLENYLQIFPKEHVKNLLDNHIIFIDKTFSFTQLNGIYNAIDLYISPYLAEGFGMTNLEALATGTHVLLPRTGSTVDYTDILMPSSSIHFVDSKIVDNSRGLQNDISLHEIINIIESIENFSKNLEINKVINEKLSWNNVADLLYSYFLYIIKK